MQRRELLQSREGENQRSDQMRGDISSNQAQIHDITQHLNQFSYQQQKGKERITIEMEMNYHQEQKEKYIKNEKEALYEVIREREGKTVPQSQIQLGYRKGLLGGCGSCTADMASAREYDAKAANERSKAEGMTQQLQDIEDVGIRNAVQQGINERLLTAEAFTSVANSLRERTVLRHTDG